MSKAIPQLTIFLYSTQVKVKFQSREVIILEDKEALGLESFFGTLGGTLNLWIGVSFVTLIEIIDMVFHIIIGLKYDGKVKDEYQDRNIKNNQPGL